MENTEELQPKEAAHLELKAKALTWWFDELDKEEQKRIQIKFGTWGHDMGLNEDEILGFYKALVIQN